MRRVVRILSYLFCLALLSPALIAQGKSKVLLIAREHSAGMGLMLTKEVKPMINMLKEAGFDVVVASDSGAQLAAYGGITLDPDMKLSDVVVTDYVGIVIPCMAAGETENWLPDSAIEIAKQASAKELPIAAQQSGVSILGYAGALNNKNWAMGDRNTSFGGNYKGAGIVQDGKIITSGTCPYMFEKLGMGADNAGTNELINLFINLLKSPS